MSVRRPAVFVVAALVAALAPAAPLASPAELGDAGSHPSVLVPVTAWDVSDAKPIPCSPLVMDGKRGCRDLVQSTTTHFDFTIHTLAGDMHFARCLYNHEVQIDGQGRTMMSHMLTGGDNPCNDIRPCLRPDRDGWLPWRGRIFQTREGRLIHRIRACIDTCLGQFKGQLEMAIRRYSGGLHVGAPKDPAGTSGFRISGTGWDWQLPELELRSPARG